MGKISTSPRYMIDITGMDPLSLEDGWGGGGGISEKVRKNEVFLTYERSDRILMKFYI